MLKFIHPKSILEENMLLNPSLCIMFPTSRQYYSQIHIISTHDAPKTLKYIIIIKICKWGT
jgi:hypothetical protein